MSFNEVSGFPVQSNNLFGKLGFHKIRAAFSRSVMKNGWKASDIDFREDFSCITTYGADGQMDTSITAWKNEEDNNGKEFSIEFRGVRILQTDLFDEALHLFIEKGKGAVDNHEYMISRSRKSGLCLIHCR